MNYKLFSKHLLFLSVSYEEIEKFAKQILVYRLSRITLLALSTTEVSREAR